MIKKQFFLGVIGIFVAFSASAKINIAYQEIDSLARQTFAYCLATVEHNKTLSGVLSKLPANVFWGEAELNSPEDTIVKFSNNDTYYNIAVLDIRYEPVVITIPEIKNRYYNVQMLDMFTNCIEYISHNANGEGSGNFLIVREDWNGDIPDKITKVIKSPSTVLLAVNRTQVLNEKDEEAKAIHAAYKITPLSEFIGTTPPLKEPLKWDYPALDPKTCDIEEYYNLFNQLISYQILSADDGRFLDEYSRVGILPGKEFKKSNFSPEIWDAIESGTIKAREKMRAITEDFSDTVFGWHFTPDYCGRYGDNYYVRAKTAWQFMYANIREEAMYYYSLIDSNNDILNGDNKYVIIFSKNFIPQPKYFWSLTIYNAKGQLIANEYNHYSLNSTRSAVKHNEDGTFTLYVQKDNPGEDKESNWLPAPDENFVLVFRVYGADTKFKPIPPVVRTNKK